MEYRVRQGKGADELSAKVELREGGGYRVKLGDLSYDIDAPDADANPRRVVVDGRVVGVYISGEEIWIDGRVTALALEPGDAPRAGTRSGVHDGALKSPMPGRVLRILVAAGDQVTPLTPVVVVEAMKMENQLFAPCSGAIESLLAQVGDTVEAGTPLLRVQPSSD